MTWNSGSCQPVPPSVSTYLIVTDVCDAPVQITDGLDDECADDCTCGDDFG